MSTSSTIARDVSDIVSHLRTGLQQLRQTGVGGLTHTQLRTQILELNSLQQEIQTALIPAFAAGRQERIFHLDGQRSDSIWLSTQTRRSRISCANQFRDADLLITKLPTLFHALNDDKVNGDHVQAILRIYRQPKMKTPVIEQIETLIQFAGQHWDHFKLDLERWAECNDPHDPADLDDKAHNDRRMISSQGLGGTTLVELDMPNEAYEQLTNCLQPHYDRMLEEEWRTARDEHGDDATYDNLTRTDAQRWLDALLANARDGFSANNTGAHGANAKVEVCIVMDVETFEREAARQNGEDVTSPTQEATSNYRCETISGRRVSPAAAMRAATFGSIRRVVVGFPDLDINASVSKRLFSKIQRQTMMIRDQTCTATGCDTKARRCQADHVIPHAAGGPTHVRNGKMKCPACHRFKSKLELIGLWDPKLDRPTLGVDLNVLLLPTGSA